MTPGTLALLLLALPAFAQLPDAPQPKQRTEMQSRFFDAQNNAAIATDFGLRLADTIQTCQLLKQRLIVTAPPQPNYFSGTYVFPYFREGMLPTQSCAGVAGWNAGFASGALGLSWLLHRTGHRKLERLPNWIALAGPAYGIIRNSRYSYHPDLSALPPGTTYTHR